MKKNVSSVNKEGQDDRAPAPRGVTKAAREMTPDWRRDSSAELAVQAWGRGRVSEGTARVAEAGGGLLRVSVPAPPGQGVSFEQSTEYRSCFKMFAVNGCN